MRLSQVICEEIPDANVVTLSGPSHAEEVANGIPTTVVAASCDIGAAESIQDIFMNPSFRYIQILMLLEWKLEEH